MDKLSFIYENLLEIALFLSPKLNISERPNLGNKVLTDSCVHLHRRGRCKFLFFFLFFLFGSTPDLA